MTCLSEWRNKTLLGRRSHLGAAPVAESSVRVVRSVTFGARDRLACRQR